MSNDIIFGSLIGSEAIVIIIFTVMAVIAILAVVTLAILRAIKEDKEAEEDRAENEFYAEYGITGEEMRLYQRLARLRAEVDNSKPVAQQVQSTQECAPFEKEEIAPTSAPIIEKPVESISPIKEAVEEEPKSEPAMVVSTPIQQPIKEEPVQIPVQEVAKIDPIQQPIEEPGKATPVVEEPKKESSVKEVATEKEDDWSGYEGPYEGYYYDPEDACYYEGAPTQDLIEVLEQKDAEYETLHAIESNERGDVAPFMPLKTPKNVRKEPQNVEGFDESSIYGKYVIEHVDTKKGTQEWFYTLYDAKGKSVYESSNYSTKEYCQRAIKRFKTHVIKGAFSMQASGGKFFFVLKHKTYTHKGMLLATSQEASKNRSAVKKFAQTDIIREQ